MKLTLLRLFDNDSETVGALYNEDEFLAFTLEDQWQLKKVKHETRIPDGTYGIKLRATGRLHIEYTRRFPNFHKGMLHLQKVPNFKYIYIHIGNTDEDTSGCILVGESVMFIKDRYRLVESTAAYRRVYELACNALEDSELFIEIKTL